MIKDLKLRAPICILEWGQPKNPSLIVLHGGPGLPGSLGPLVSQLSKTFFVLEVYQRSFLHTGCQGSFKLQDHCDDLIELCEALDQKPAILGHSFGAVLSLLTLSQKPEIASAFVALSSAPINQSGMKEFSEGIQKRMTAEDRLKRKRILRELFRRRADDPELQKQWDSYLPLISKAYHFDPQNDKKLKSLRWDARVFKEGIEDVERIFKAANAALPLNLAHFKGPLIAIHGDHDPQSPECFFDALKASINRDFESKVIPHAGHFPWLETERSLFDFQEYIKSF